MKKHLSQQTRMWRPDNIHGRLLPGKLRRYHRTMGDTLLSRTSDHKNAGENAMRFFAFANDKFTTSIFCCLLLFTLLENVEKLVNLSIYAARTIKELENMPGDLRQRAQAP